MAELLLVLGMHRSGTSAFARAMRVFGGELGAHLLPPAADNPKGFYEDEELQQINDDFLLSLGARWDSLNIPSLTELPDATIQEYQERVWSVLQPKFPNEGFFVFKDPRMCRLWPLWVDLLVKYEVTVRVLWVLRNPVAVAESLLQRDSMPLLVGLLLWNMHNRSLLDALRHWPHYSTVSYESLLNDPDEVIAQIGRDFKMQPISASLITEFVEGFLDRNLNHASTEERPLGSELQEIMTICKQQYLIGQDANTSLTNKQQLFSKLGENGLLYIENLDFFARQRDELQLHAHNLNLERQSTREYVTSIKNHLESIEIENGLLRDKLVKFQSEDYRIEEYATLLKENIEIERSVLRKKLEKVELEYYRTEKYVSIMKSDIKSKEIEIGILRDKLEKLELDLRLMEERFFAVKEVTMYKEEECTKKHAQFEVLRRLAQDYRQRTLYLESLIVSGRIPPGTRGNKSWK